VRELEETIRDAAADVVVIGTPVDLRRILSIAKRVVRVRYELRELEPGVIEGMVAGQE
jgi:predicted GTPase